jgi:hypothetical protein
MERRAAGGELAKELQLWGDNKGAVEDAVIERAGGGAVGRKQLPIGGLGIQDKRPVEGVEGFSRRPGLGKEFGESAGNVLAILASGELRSIELAPEGDDSLRPRIGKDAMRGEGSGRVREKYPAISHIRKDFNGVERLISEPLNGSLGKEIGVRISPDPTGQPRHEREYIMGIFNVMFGLGMGPNSLVRRLHLRIRRSVDIL